MADQTTQKGIDQQPNATPDATDAKAVTDTAATGDRELSDADLDRVSGGTGLRTVDPKPHVGSIIDRSF